MKSITVESFLKHFIWLKSYKGEPKKVLKWNSQCLAKKVEQGMSRKQYLIYMSIVLREIKVQGQKT